MDGYGRRYNRAVGICQLILEGNTYEEDAKEYDVGATTAKNDVMFLCSCYNTVVHGKLAKDALVEIERRKKKK